MRQNKSAMIGFLCVVLIASIGILIGKLMKPNVATPLTTKHTPSNIQEIGTYETVIEYTDHYSYTVFYPVVGSSRIDANLKSLTESFISDFLSEYSDYTAKSLDELATLTVTYDTYFTGNQILSVKFTLDDYNPRSADLSQKTYVANYNLEKDETLKVEEYFHPTYPNVFIDKLEDHLSGLPEYANALNDSAFQQTLDHMEENLSFYFTNAGVTLCVRVPNKDTEQLDLVELTITMDDLLPILKQNPFTPMGPTDDTTNGEADSMAVEPNTRIPAVDPDKPMVALTFDDGPFGKVTNRILNLLEENQSRATFFVLGARIKKEKATIRRAVSIGCQIGNHTYSHKSLTSLNKKSIHHEIEQTNVILKKTNSLKTKLIRPPFGAVNSFVRKNASYPLIHWSVDTKDWKTNNKKKTIKRTLNNIKDGDIVLLHDLYESTADACEVIIPRLIKDGYQLVTVQELFEYKGITLKDGKSYYSAR